MEKHAEKLIVALDLDSPSEARSVVSELKGTVGAFKVGLQLFTGGGRELVRDLVESGVRVFLDLKFHDIPNTVASAAVEAARLGVWMFNVHAFGGGEMMRRTSDSVREFCSSSSTQAPIMLAVTVLTSWDQENIREIGVTENLSEQILRLARLTKDSGFDGVVASAHEVSSIRGAVGDGFTVLTPGIRPSFATKDDQKRVMTPAEAVRAGSDYIVVGRPVLNAPDRARAVEAILGELAGI